MKGLIVVLACAIGPADLPHCGTNFELRVMAGRSPEQPAPPFLLLKVTMPRGVVLEVKEQRTGRIVGVVRPFGAQGSASYRFPVPEGSETGGALLQFEASWPDGAAVGSGPPTVCVEEARLSY